MQQHRQDSARMYAVSQLGKSKSCFENITLTSFIGFALTLFLFMSAAHADEISPYARHYKEQNTSKLKSLDPNPDTKIFVSNHKDEDNISMLENGYDMIGSSGFSAAETSFDLALQHAKAIKADTVLVYKKYESAKTVSSKLQLIKEAAKTGGEIDPVDLAEEDVQYYYYASYWAKLPPPLLGVHIIKLQQKVTEAEQAQIKDEPGLKVIAVIKESPAAQAGIVRGDAMLKLGAIALENAEDLFIAVKKYAGKTVDAEIERQGVSKKVSVTLNAKS